MDRRQPNPQHPPLHQSPGEILADAVYRADEVKQRMGWSDSAFRAAKRRGLTVRRDGKRAYVFGKDVFKYLDRGTDAPPLPTDNPTCAGR